MLYLFFVLLQIILLFFITLHDWIEIKPYNDIGFLRKNYSLYVLTKNSIIFACIVGIPLLLTLLYPAIPLWVAVQLVIFYSLTTMGTIYSWWIPYFWGSS